MLTALLLLGCVPEADTCAPLEYCETAWSEAAGDCEPSGHCQEQPVAPDFDLWLPIPAGEATFCAKGSLRPTGSHGVCSATGRFAVDLATPAYSPPHLVLASADGTAWPFGGCSTQNLDRSHSDRCNLGWGNMVHVEHAHGLYTLYAHLSSILVQPGEVVQRGQPIGVEGNTGAAGGKHIHWSLHRGDARVGGVAPSIPMKRVHLAGAVKPGAALPCGDWLHDGRVHSETRLESATQVVGPAADWFLLQRTAPPTLEQSSEGLFPMWLVFATLGGFGLGLAVSRLRRT